jgi:hypothetical protein
MPEEKNATQNPEGAAESGDASAKGGIKNRKINRMTAQVLESKIEDIEKAGFTESTYYKHLLQRKRELESSPRS